MKKHKGLISLLILLLLIAVTFGYIFKNNDLQKTLVTIKEVNWIYLLLGLLLMFVFIVSEGMGIGVLLKSLHYHRSFLKCLKYSFLGFYYCSVVPASGGQPVQIYYMSRDEIEVGDASLCIMVISISYQIGMLLICLFALIMRFHFITSSLGVIKYFALLGAAVNIALVLLCLSVTFRSEHVRKIIAALIALLAKIKLVKNPEKAAAKVEGQLERFGKGASYMRRNPNVLFWTLVSIVVQVLSRLSIAYCVYLSFGLHGYGYLDILSLQAFLALGVEYLPIPGSVGITEACFYRVNRMIFGSGQLISATLLTRGISYYAYLLISGAVAVYAHLALTFRQRRNP